MLLVKRDLPGARQAFAEALEIFTTHFGLEHTETAICLGDLGKAALLLGDLPTARSTTEQAFNVLSTRLPQKHPDHLKIREQLAVLNGMAER